VKGQAPAGRRRGAGYRTGGRAHELWREAPAGVVMAVALAAFPAWADAPTYRVEPSLTTAEFAVAHLGVFHQHGRFARMSGRIAYDPAVPTGRVDFDISSASVTTGWSVRDAFVRSEAMFDAEHHPLVQFRSTHLEFEGDRLARIDGDLTLRGVTRPVSFAVTHMACGRELLAGRDGCDAEAGGTIRRSDFAMDFAWPLIGDEVELRFRVTAIRE